MVVLALVVKNKVVLVMERDEPEAQSYSSIGALYNTHTQNAAANVATQPTELATVSGLLEGGVAVAGEWAASGCHYGGATILFRVPLSYRDARQTLLLEDDGGATQSINFS